MKIVPEDIFEAVKKDNFSEQEINEMKEKLKYFENFEKKPQKKKFTEEELLELARKQNEMFQKIAEESKDKDNQLNFNVDNQEPMKIEENEQEDDFADYQ